MIARATRGLMLNAKGGRLMSGSAWPVAGVVIAITALLLLSAWIRSFGGMRRRFPGASATNQHWELWYRDLFDRECPPQCEAKGVGLVEGLKKLWERRLCEGATGLASFHLQCGPRRIDIAGDGSGGAAAQLRRWTFPAHGDADRDAAADDEVLEKVAATHAVLVRRGSNAQPIFQAAAEATSREQFLTRLANLAAC